MIPIQNVYYMLAYAFQVLTEQGYKKIKTEHFNNAYELCASILIQGLLKQIQSGLKAGYIIQTDSLSSLHGKIDVSESIKRLTVYNRQMVCSFDEFSVNTKENGIIKSTLTLLLHANIDKKRKKEVKKLLAYFKDVDSLNLYSIDWNIPYNRGNRSYQMLISTCYLVFKGLLQTQSDGYTKLMDYFDEQRMCRLYEKFILEYYKKTFSEISVSASQIPWQLDDGVDEMLPVMKSDIMLSYQDKVLIIDAKYYSHTTQSQYGVHTLHSNNLYQIFTYVKNKEYELRNSVSHEVAGMLLYAQTDEVKFTNNEYKMSGNKLSVRTLDLNRNFADISADLDSIAKNYFGL